MINIMISVIVPVYNVEKYLAKCIESILKQSYRNFELILVDDGSPDKCPVICDQYAEQDERIIVIHQENSGVSAARNAGLDKAKGKYIGFVDPDDFIAPDMYEKMLYTMEQCYAELVICGYEYYDESYRIDEKRQYPEKAAEILNQKELMRRMSDMPPTVRHGVVNKLFRTEYLKNLRFVEGLHSSEDVLFLTEYLKVVKTAVFVHQPFYKNLVRIGSATHGGLNIQSLAASFKAHDDMYETIVHAYPELKNHSLAFLLDVCTLKYNESKCTIEHLSAEECENAQMILLKMKKYIKRRAWQAIFDGEIYWKTRMYYLMLR